MILLHEKQVTSPELSKRLKEKGVPQESLWYWVNIEHVGWRLVNKKDSELLLGILKKYSAFTVAELGEMLPPEVTEGGSVGRQKSYPIFYIKNNNKEIDGEPDISYSCECGSQSITSEMSEAETRGLMLEWLIDTTKIKEEDLG